MDNTEQKKLIWTVTAVTTCVLALVTAIVVVLCAVFAPKSYADFITALGFKNAGLVSYEYQYERSGDINDLYNLNVKSILAENDKYIKKSYEALAEREDYYDFVRYVERCHINESVSKLAMVYVSNEDDYLKANYTKALYRLGEDAFGFAYADLVRSSVTTIDARYNFVLSAYISVATVDELKANVTERVANEIARYKDDLMVLYRHETGTDAVVKYRLSVIVYKIINILSAMKILNEAVGYFDIDALNETALSLSGELMELTR